MPRPAIQPADPSRRGCRAKPVRWRLIVIAIGILVCGMSPVWSQEAAETPPSPVETTVELVEILIEPARPAEAQSAPRFSADTLCTLTLRLRNRGPRPVSAFVFEVDIEGSTLPVYEKQVFMSLMPPSNAARSGSESPTASADTTYDLRLFNFWTSDSVRPAPTDGSLDVRVRLLDAQWVDARFEDDGTEVWSLEGTVPGLPIERAIALPFGDAARP